MAKNRAQLESTAYKLNLDPLQYKSNKSLQAAISEARKNNASTPSSNVNKEGDKTTTKVGHTVLAPDPSVQNTGGKAKGKVILSASDESQQREVQSESDEDGVSFETNQVVKFTVNSVTYEGTSFSFPADVVEDRKRIVREAYGEDVIK